MLEGDSFGSEAIDEENDRNRLGTFELVERKKGIGDGKGFVANRKRRRRDKVLVIEEAMGRVIFIYVKLLV